MANLLSVQGGFQKILRAPIPPKHHHPRLQIHNQVAPSAHRWPSSLWGETFTFLCSRLTFATSSVSGAFGKRSLASLCGAHFHLVARCCTDGQISAPPHRPRKTLEPQPTHNSVSRPCHHARSTCCRLASLCIVLPLRSLLRSLQLRSEPPQLTASAGDSLNKV